MLSDVPDQETGPMHGSVIKAPQRIRFLGPTSLDPLHRLKMNPPYHQHQWSLMRLGHRAHYPSQSDDLAGMTRRVFGRVEDEPERRGGQPFSPDLSTEEEGVGRDGPKIFD